MPIEMDAIVTAFGLSPESDADGARWSGRVGACDASAIHIGIGPPLTRAALARLADTGAHVTGTGQANARQRVLDLAAEEFVDVEQEGWETAVGQVDLVYDIIGGEVLARSAAFVKPGGAIVSVVAPVQTDRSDIRTVGFVRDANGAQLREIARLVDEGMLRPQVDAVFPLADAREAFMAKSSKHIPGKVVLTP